MSATLAILAGGKGRRLGGVAKGLLRCEGRPILDRLPIGILVYRLNNLIYANRAFLDRDQHLVIVGQPLDQGRVDGLCEPRISHGRGRPIGEINQKRRTRAVHLARGGIRYHALDVCRDAGGGGAVGRNPCRQPEFIRRSSAACFPAAAG